MTLQTFVKYGKGEGFLTKIYHRLNHFRNWYNPNLIQSGATPEIQKRDALNGTL